MQIIKMNRTRNECIRRNLQVAPIEQKIKKGGYGLGTYTEDQKQEFKCNKFKGLGEKAEKYSLGTKQLEKTCQNQWRDKIKALDRVRWKSRNHKNPPQEVR